MSTAPLTRRNRTAIYVAVFLAFIDNFALLPVIGPRAQELGGTPFLVGIAIAAYSLANLAFDPIGGVLADRLGRRRVVLAALIISPAAIAVYAFADSLPLFLLARLYIQLNICGQEAQPPAQAPVYVCVCVCV
jgi:MFS family permease